jgi:hypothetical protein
MPRSKKRGTADLELGQYNEVLGQLQRALPKALVGIPYEDLKDVPGEALEPALHQAFLNAIQEQTQSSPKNMELVEFLEQGESSITGNELLRRAKELGADGGLKQAQNMLKRQGKIPKEFGPYILVFGKPEIRDGKIGFPCLYLGDDRWHLHFNWLEHDFNSYYRLVRFRK